MVDLVLVRHGRTAANAARQIAGALDVPLDDVGRSQARELAAAWRYGTPDAVFSSPLQRAVETARLLGAEPVRLGDLRELHQGELEGLPAAEAMARFGEVFAAFARDPVACRLPGGESLGECRDRALTALQRIASARDHGTVLVVTHQMVIASVSCTIAGAPLDRWREFAVSNCGVSVLRVEGRAPAARWSWVRGD